jgi:hypothetical protein
VIVRLDTDGAVVADADDCSAVHVETGLDADGLRTALVTTGTGAPAEPDRWGADVVVLDIAVLRSRARLLATAPDWTERFDGMLTGAGERLTDDGLGLRVPVERTV